MQNIQEALDYVYDNIKKDHDNKLFQDKQYLRAMMEQLIFGEIARTIPIQDLQKIDALMSQKTFQESDLIANIPQYPQILQKVVNDLLIDYIIGPQEEEEE